MITWVTVWVLTVQYNPYSDNNVSYQLTYRTKQTCLIEAKKHKGEARCDFQQIPMVIK